MENNANTKKKSTIIPVICALAALVASVAYIVVKIMQEQEYERKWGEYDDCGWM